MKMLMVCLGNICRSPLAEGILQDKVNKQGLNWEVDSAGTANYHVGEPPHKLSIKVAKQNGVDISKQVCRQFSIKDFDYFDKIFVMDLDNYKNVVQLSPSKAFSNKVSLILNELFPNENMEVPDPWYGTEINFIEVFSLLDKACDAIIKNYTTK